MISSKRAVIVAAISSVLLASNSPWALSLSTNGNQNQSQKQQQQGLDRRSAIHQAGSTIAAAAFGTTTVTASGLLLPNSLSPQLARAAGTDAIINPIATLADGSKFPLASFGLQ